MDHPELDESTLCECSFLPGNAHRRLGLRRPSTPFTNVRIKEPKSQEAAQAWLIQRKWLTRVFMCALPIIVWILPQSVLAWTEPVNISNTPKRSSYPAITVDNWGRVHATWTEDYLEISRIFYTRCDGDTWSTPLDVSRNTEPTYFYWSSVAVDNESRVHVIWTHNAQDLMWTYCDGDTWSIPVNISNTAGLTAGPKTAVDGSGRIHLVWHDQGSGEVEIYYRMYDGESWQERQRITHSPGEAHSGWPDIAVDSRGHPHVVWEYYGGTGSASDYWIRYSMYDGTTWSAPVDVLRIDGEPIVEGETAIDSEGRPHVVAERWQSEAIYYTHYDGTAWAPPYLVYEGSGARKPDIAVDTHSKMGCVVWGDKYYRFFQDTGWDSVGNIGGSPEGIAPALAVGTGTLHLIWTTTAEIYYSRHDLTGIESTPGEPVHERFRLEQNFPNPFESRTTIAYALPEAGYVSLEISDIAGRIIADLDLGYRSKGSHTFSTSVGLLKDGGDIPAGVYFYTIKAGHFRATSKLLILH